MPDGQVRDFTLIVWGKENNVSSTFSLCKVELSHLPAVRKLLRDCMTARILAGLSEYSRGEDGHVSACCLALRCLLTSSASPAAAWHQLTACWRMCHARRCLFCTAGGSGCYPDPLAGCHLHTVLHATASDVLQPPAFQATPGLSQVSSRSPHHCFCLLTGSCQEQLLPPRSRQPPGTCTCAPTTCVPFCTLQH